MTVVGTSVPETSKFDIFLDGACPFCQWTRSRIEPFDSKARLRFLDYNDPEIERLAPYPRAELDREMHVRTPEGRWLKGFDAWIVVLRALPKLAWLGWVTGVPPLGWLGPGLYRYIARHRYSLPGVPPRCDNDSCAPTRQ